MNMKRYNMLIAAGFLILACYIFLGSIELGLGQLRNPGAGFFPFLSALSLGILSLILLLSSLKGAVTQEQLHWPKGIHRWRIMLTLSTLVLYAFVLNTLGYFIGTLLLLLFLLKVVAAQKWALSISVAAFAVLITYLLFGVWLNVPFPKFLGH